MVIFGTDKDYNFNGEDIKTSTFDKVLAHLDNFISNKVDFKEDIVLGIDLETTGLDPYVNDPLLVAIGVLDRQYVFDVTNKENGYKLGKLIEKWDRIIKWLGQNLKFDNCMLLVNLLCRLQKMYDIMIAEQRIYQNMDYSYGFESILLRHTGQEFQVDKKTRLEFIGVNPQTHRFTEKQIRYSAFDIKNLFPIYDSQCKLIDKYKLHFLLSEKMEFGLINVLSDAELEGFYLNEEQWRDNIAKNEELEFITQVKLDEEIRKLRDNLLEGEERLSLVGGMYDQIRRKHPKIISTDLFGGKVTFADMQGGKGKKRKKVKINTNNPNYSSPTQMVRLFGNLKQLMPTKYGRYEIPVLKLVKTKQGGTKIKIMNKEMEFSTKKEYLEQYILKFSTSAMVEFVKQLIVYRKTNKKIDSFGENFILNYTNPVTGKIHTIFRQCSETKGDDTEGKSPINGRLSSGDTSRGRPNMQNIPREKEYRTAFFVDPKYSVITCDLGGAEITTMTAKSQDEKLLRYVNEGIFHDYAATHGWRRIFNLRANTLKEFTALIGQSHKEEYRDLMDKVANFVVDKKNNPDLRQIGKNMHFGIFYGLHEKKGSETLNITREEAKVYIDFIRQAFPKTIKKLQSYEYFAIDNGYLIIDERTNARIWFPRIVRNIRHNIEVANRNKQNPHKHLHEQYTEIEFMEKIEIGGQARNIPISGTQANMLKESMVEIYDYIKKHGLDCKILLQVHDELVVRCPKNMDGQSDEWNEDPKYVYFKLDNPIDIKDDDMREYYGWDKYDIDVSKDVRSLTIHDGKLYGFHVDFPKFVALTMCEVANRYLNGFKMRADYHVADTWTK